MPVEAQSDAFAFQTRAVMRRLRDAFSDVIVSAGADPQDAQSIGRQVGLNKNLAWKISKIVETDDPVVALEQLPGAAGIKIFLAAAEKAGAESGALGRARAAVDEFDSLIRVHSGDRATLEMMGSELSAAGRRERDEQHRKLLFQGASYVWGAQARVNLKIGVAGPSEQPGCLDFASLSGLVDFRRLRPDVSWIVATRHLNNDDGTQMGSTYSEALDSRFNGPGEVPLMGDFCSQPLPRVRSFEDRQSTCFELVEGPVGNTGALTCVLGTVQRGLPFVRSEQNEWGEHSARCDIPAELLVLDFFAHRSFRFAIPPRATLYSDLGGLPKHPSARRERNRLPMHEAFVDLGEGVLPSATPEVPRYGAMVRSLFERTGWDPDEFHGFRLKVAYPAYPAAVIVGYRLPEGERR